MTGKADEFLDGLDRKDAELRMETQKEESKRNEQAEKAFRECEPLVREYLEALARRHFEGDEFEFKFVPDSLINAGAYAVMGRTWHDGQKKMKDSEDEVPYYVEKRFKWAYWIKVVFTVENQVAVIKQTHNVGEAQGKRVKLTEENLQNLVAEMHRFPPEMIFEGDVIPYNYYEKLVDR